MPINTQVVEFKLRSWRGVLDTTVCDKVCQWLATGRWFSPCPPVSPTSKTDCHDITEILLKVALNTINQAKPTFTSFIYFIYVTPFFSDSLSFLKIHCFFLLFLNIWALTIYCLGLLIFWYRTKRQKWTI